MTTIAYKDGELAADSRITAGDTIITDGRKKVHRLRDGSIVAWAGSLQDAMRLLTSMRKGHVAPKLDEIEALHVHTDGSVWEYEGHVWVKQQVNEHCAVGSGTPYALAAMDAGASAREAVKIAVKRDINSGGRVQSLSLKGS